MSVTGEPFMIGNVYPQAEISTKRRTMESYYELVAEDGTRTRLDSVNSVESAKATAKTVANITGESVELFKVQQIDPEAPPVTRRRTS